MKFIHLPIFLLCFTLSPNSFAQFSLDEFETDVKGGIKEESDAKKATEVATPVAEEAPVDGDFEKIQVTGSHIKRMDTEGASPVMTLDRSMMERSGYNSVSDVLRDLSANSFGSTREQAGSSAAGVASVSLRGMGSNKTLVLLNGKRLPVDVITGSVDLNLIPMAAVQRIEILKDGASATYGSDALGGVVNIITYRDYNGSEVSAQKSFTKLEGAETQEVNFITGSSTSKSSVVSVFSYRQNQGFFSKDRKWTEDGRSMIGSPGSYRATGGLWKPAADCAAEDVSSIGANSFCSFNFAQFSSELPDLKQLSAMTLFEYETDHDVTLFGRVGVSRRIVNWQYAPAPGTFNGTTPDGAGQIRYRTVELGNREQDDETTAIGYQAGMKGSIGTAWDWEATLDKNRVRRMSIGRSGYALESVINKLILDGDFKPLDPAGSRDPDGKLSTSFYEPWQDSRAENTQLELKFTGELFDLPGGTVGAALGAVKNYDKFTDKTDPLSERGEVFSSGGSSGGGKRESKSFYVETIAPVFRGFELQLAGRYDDFSDFGSTTNPKVGLKWNVTQNLLFRASAGTGFMAPTLKDLYAADSFGFPTFIDEVACQDERTNTPNDTPSCNPMQYSVQSGGNANLQEEKSKSINVGTVVQLNKKSNMSLDYWITKLDNVVGINYQELTRAELNGSDVSKYGIEIVRDPVTNQIDSITAPLQNLSKQDISGLDFRLELHFGVLRVVSDHAHILYFKQEGFPGSGFTDILKLNGFPQWRNNTSFNLDFDKTSWGLLFRTISENEKAVRGEGNLPRYTEIDFNLNISLFDKTTLIFGIQNVLGSTPPIDDTNPNSQLNTALYSPRGPLAFVGFKQGF